MDKLLDKNYNIISRDESNIFKDEFDRLIDMFLEMYKDNKISKSSLETAIKLALYSQLKGELKKEKRNLVDFLNVKKEKQTDTFFVSLQNKNKSYSI